MPKRTPPPVRARLRPRLPDDPAAGDPALAGDELDWADLAVADVELPAELEVLSIRACHLRGVRFTACRVDRLDVADSVLEACELSGALLSRAVLERVELRRCRMSGVDLSRATLQDVLLDGCRLDEANLRAAVLGNVDADDCELRGADLYGAKVERSNLVRCNLTGADFSKCQLQRVLLHGSNLVDVQGGAALAGAIISRDQVVALAPSLTSALGIVVDDDFTDAASPG